jgi:hypothetical protein
MVYENGKGKKGKEIGEKHILMPVLGSHFLPTAHSAGVTSIANRRNPSDCFAMLSLLFFDALGKYMRLCFSIGHNASFYALFNSFAIILLFNAKYAPTCSVRNKIGKDTFHAWLHKVTINIFRSALSLFQTRRWEV